MGEAGVVSALYALWQLAGTVSVLGTDGAFARARALLRWEHDLHLPAESSVQRAFAAHPVLVQAANVYYATMHFGGLFLFLLWLFVRHRDAYRRVRLTLILLTTACLVIALLPVAPPRLMPGFIDTARQYGQSVYNLGIDPDQLSAMPSVHVAWALLIAWTCWQIAPHRWRWIGVVHAAVTVLVVVATANHFWLDGAVAALVLAACLAGQSAGRRLVALRRAAARTPAAVGAFGPDAAAPVAGQPVPDPA